jgi:hypothetical protein
MNRKHNPSTQLHKQHLVEYFGGCAAAVGRVLVVGSSLLL